MAKYTNIAVALGNQSGNGSSKTFTFSASSINSLVNNTLPSECKITRAVIQFRGAKPYSFSGKGDITISLGSYSRSYNDVIANDGGNDDFGSADTLCTSDDIKGYINSNGRFSSDLKFTLGTSTLSTYWRVEATIYFDYDIPYTISVSAGAGGSVTNTGGTYNAGTTFSVQANPSIGYKFKGWANSSGVIATTANPFSFTVSGSASFSAVFEPITYSIGYVANGGEGSMNAVSATFNTAVTLPDCTFTRKEIVQLQYEEGNNQRTEVNLPFAGWMDYTGATDKYGTYYPYQEFDAPYYANTQADLYAAFGYDKFALVNHYVDHGKAEGRKCVSDTGVRGTYPNKATVKNLTTGGGGSASLCAAWGAASFTLPTPTREGYNFLHWVDDNGNTYSGNETVSVTSFISLTAVWEKSLPEIKNVQMIYLDKQISATNKVPCGEGFVISLELS